LRLVLLALYLLLLLIWRISETFGSRNFYTEPASLLLVYNHIYIISSLPFLDREPGPCDSLRLGLCLFSHSYGTHYSLPELYCEVRLCSSVMSVINFIICLQYYIKTSGLDNDEFEAKHYMIWLKTPMTSLSSFFLELLLIYMKAVESALSYELPYIKHLIGNPRALGNIITSWILCVLLKWMTSLGPLLSTRWLFLQRTKHRKLI
jgi:hypothetical protein